MKTVLSHANLIDCVEPKVRPDCAVLIEDGRIRAILRSGEAGSAGDAQMIDLKGGYLMPGLWDVHIHPDYLSLDEMPLVRAPRPTTSPPLPNTSNATPVSRYQRRAERLSSRRESRGPSRSGSPVPARGQGPASSMVTRNGDQIGDPTTDLGRP